MYNIYYIGGGYNRRMSGDRSAREEYRKIYTYTSELRKFENTIKDSVEVPIYYMTLGVATICLLVLSRLDNSVVGLKFREFILFLKIIGNTFM